MKKFVLILLGISWLIYACEKEPIDPQPIQELYGTVELFDFASVPFNNLSAYNFFDGVLKNLEANVTLLPYDLTTGLFSNYATKQRLVYFPPDKSAAYINDGQKTLDFPNGSIIIKTFYYNNDFNDESKGKRIIETRLLIRKNNEWEVANYIWNDEQTEAFHKVGGRQVNVKWLHYDGSQRSTLYSIPNDNECKGCHELGEEMVLIGPKARLLNKDFNYLNGSSNQLEKWAELGLLDGLPEMTSVPKTALFDDNEATLEAKARTYLDINCAHCHNADGPANNTSLFLNYEQNDSWHLGNCKPPVAAGGGSGGLDYAVVPGAADESIMIHRLNSLELDVSMPELGRSVIHEEGLQLLTDWVDSLEGNCD